MIKWGQEAGQSSGDESEVCGGFMVKGLTLQKWSAHQHELDSTLWVYSRDI